MNRITRSFALCREFDPDTWFPTGDSGPALMQAEEAKAVCRQCPIRDACLDYALRMGIDFGVWGGFTETERRAIIRRNGVTRRGANEDHRTRLPLVRELASQA